MKRMEILCKATRLQILHGPWSIHSIGCIIVFHHADPLYFLTSETLLMMMERQGKGRSRIGSSSLFFTSRRIFYMILTNKPTIAYLNGTIFREKLNNS